MKKHHLFSATILTAMITTAGCKTTPPEPEVYERAAFQEPEPVVVEVPVVIPLAEPPAAPKEDDVSSAEAKDMESIPLAQTYPIEPVAPTAVQTVEPLPLASDAQSNNEIAPLPLLNAAGEPQVITEKKIYTMPGQLKPLPGHEEAASPEELYQKMLTEANNDATRFPAPEGFINSMTVYDYVPNALYKIYAAPGRITSVTFEAGELIQAVAAGDTVRWLVETVNSGTGADAKTHLFVKPLKPELTTNVVVATDRRMYNIEAHSLEESYMASVSWNYPYNTNATSRNKMGIIRNRTATQSAERVIGKSDSEQANVSLNNLNFNYTISSKSKKNHWKPVRVFDDGQKTFIQFPNSAASYEAPVLFIKTINEEAQLVNYRVKKPYYIVDRLFDKAELRIGNKKPIVITIERDES